MSDIKVVLYRDNRTPRSIALSPRTIYRTLFLAAFFAIVIVSSLAAAAKFYVLSRAKVSQTQTPSAATNDENEVGPTNSLEDQNRSLRDQLEQARLKLQNAQALHSAPKEIERKNAALALFGPLVTDKTQDQSRVLAQNFKYSKGGGKVLPTLTFELHNAHPGESTEKGYIVVLARTETGLQAYPNIFNKTGPYLVDFEKGETFQVARFRLVNAQFDLAADTFQILIFSRAGELLINTSYEVAR